jgi:hypothetical protein
VDKGDLTCGFAHGMLRPALVIPFCLPASFDGGMWKGLGAEHKVGSGSVFVVDTNTVLTGTLGEGPGCFRERVVCFACLLWGLTCLRVGVPLVGPL